MELNVTLCREWILSKYNAVSTSLSKRFADRGPIFTNIDFSFIDMRFLYHCQVVGIETTQLPELFRKFIRASTVSFCCSRINLPLVHRKIHQVFMFVESAINQLAAHFKPRLQLKMKRLQTVSVFCLWLQEPTNFPDVVLVWRKKEFLKTAIPGIFQFSPNRDSSKMQLGALDA